MSRIRLLLFAVVAALALSACQVRVDQTTSLREDGSGRVGVIVAADEEFRQAISSFGGGGAENPFEATAAELGPEYEWSEFSEDGFLGIQVTRDFADLAEYETIADDLGDLAGVEFPFPELTMDGDNFSFVAEIPEFDEEAFAGIGTGTGFDLSTLPLDDLFDIRVAVRLPGELTAHNGEAVAETGQVVWDLGINSGPLTLTAESELSGFPWWIVAVGAVALALIAFVVVRIVRKPRNASPAEAPVVVVPD